MSKAKGALGVLLAVGLGVVNGITVFKPAFKELKEEKEGGFKAKHGEEGGEKGSERPVGQNIVSSESAHPVKPPSSSNTNVEGKMNVEGGNHINSGESKGFDGMSTASTGSERKGDGRDVEKGSWWKGMGVWARVEKDVGRVRGEGEIGDAATEEQGKRGRR